MNRSVLYLIPLSNACPLTDTRISTTSVSVIQWIIRALQGGIKRYRTDYTYSKEIPSEVSRLELPEEFLPRDLSRNFFTGIPAWVHPLGFLTREESCHVLNTRTFKKSTLVAHSVSLGVSVVLLRIAEIVTAGPALKFFDILWFFQEYFRWDSFRRSCFVNSIRSFSPEIL